MITIEDIRRLPVCQDPSNWIPEGWQGELLDLYNLENLDIDGKILMGVFFLPDEELLAFCDFCKAQADALVGSSGSFTQKLAKCVKAYGHAHLWHKVWNTAFFAKEAAREAEVDSSVFVREAQLNYLIELEQNRGQ